MFNWIVKKNMLSDVIISKQLDKLEFEIVGLKIRKQPDKPLSLVRNCFNFLVIHLFRELWKGQIFLKVRIQQNGGFLIIQEPKFLVYLRN